MKKYINQVAILSLFTIAISCNRDELNVAPNNGPQLENFYNTNGDFRAGVDYAYDAFKGTGYYAQASDLSQVIIPDIISDNLIQSPSGRGSNGLINTFDFASNVGGVTSFYGAGYAVVARANTVLNNINKLPAGAFKNNIEAESRAIRALAHFDIVTRYSKIPTQSVDADASLGIAYVETYDPFALHTRDLTVSQVYDKIIGDLTFAEQNLTANTGTTDVVVGRFTKAAVQGLLSKVYLYKGDYDNAILWGQKSMTTSPSVGSATNFKNIWADASNDGVLFKVLNSSVENIKIGSAYNQTVSGQVRSEFVVDYSLFQKYKATDIRKDAYILTSPFGSGANVRNYNNVIKYRQATGKPIEAVDIKVIRTAEVALNVAEAMYKTGNVSGALSLLNTLRSQRYTGFVTGAESGTALWDAIMLERRLELAFETDRFFTLKRLGMPIERSNFGPYFDGSGNPVQATAKILPADSHKWQWPIPQAAIQVNTNIVQNPGYQ